MSDADDDAKAALEAAARRARNKEILKQSTENGKTVTRAAETLRKTSLPKLERIFEHPKDDWEARTRRALNVGDVKTISNLLMCYWRS